MNTTVFHRETSASFGVAIFNLRSFGTDIATTMGVVNEQLGSSMLVSHEHSEFVLPGTGLTFLNVTIVVTLPEVTTFSLHVLSRSLQQAPIISAVHVRSWSVAEHHEQVRDFVPDGLLTDAEARSLALQHPEVAVRAYFGAGEDGRMILRTVVVGSVQDDGESSEEAD